MFRDGAALFRGQAQRLVDTAWTRRRGRQAAVSADPRIPPHLQAEEEHQELARLISCSCIEDAQVHAPLSGWEEDDREVCPRVWRALLQQACAMEQALCGTPTALREALVTGAASRRPPRALCLGVLRELCRQALRSLVEPERWDGAAIALSESKTIGDAAMQKPCPHDPAKRSKRAYAEAHRLAQAGCGTSDLVFELRPARTVAGLPLEEPWSGKKRQRGARALLAAGLRETPESEATLDAALVFLEEAAASLAAAVGCSAREARDCCANWAAARFNATQRGLRAMLELLLEEDTPQPTLKLGEEVLVRLETTWHVARRLPSEGLLALSGAPPPSRASGAYLRLALGEKDWRDARVVRYRADGVDLQCSTEDDHLLVPGLVARTRSGEEPAVVTRAQKKGRLEVVTRAGRRSAREESMLLFSCRRPCGAEEEVPTKKRRRGALGSEAPTAASSSSGDETAALPGETSWGERFLHRLPRVLRKGPCSKAWRRAAALRDDGCQEEEAADGNCRCMRALEEQLRLALLMGAPPLLRSRARCALERELACADGATLCKQTQLRVAAAARRAAAWRHREKELLAVLSGQDGRIVARRTLLQLPPEAAALAQETRCRVRGCTGVLLKATRQDRSADEEGTAILYCCVCGAVELDRA